MDIYITFDYEVFLGPNSGTVQNCLISPTEKLLKIAQKHDVRFVFFIDTLFLLKMKEYTAISPILRTDFQRIENQLNGLSNAGHDLQLHLHPQWYYSTYDPKHEKWELDYRHYKLSDCPVEDISQMLLKSISYLQKFSKGKINAFRAGGYSFPNEPFFYTLLKDSGIKHDSSVLMKKSADSAFQCYDYKTIKSFDQYQFDSDLTTQQDSGFFTEYPISVINQSPLIYYFHAIRFKHKKHLRETGDGSGINNRLSRATRLKQLIQRLFSPVKIPASLDAFYPYWLTDIKKAARQTSNTMVIIGHPKRQTEYSLIQLDRFLSQLEKSDSIKTWK